MYNVYIVYCEISIFIFHVGTMLLLTLFGMVGFLVYLRWESIFLFRIRIHPCAGFAGIGSDYVFFKGIIRIRLFFMFSIKYLCCPFFEKLLDINLTRILYKVIGNVKSSNMTIWHMTNLNQRIQIKTPQKWEIWKYSSVLHWVFLFWGGTTLSSC